MIRRSPFATTLALGLVMALLSLSRAAYACPSCAGGQDRFSTTLKLLGIFILFPYFVVALVLRAIRNAEKESASHPIDESESA